MTALKTYHFYGGNSKKGHFGDVIPGNSELIYQLDVLECYHNIDKFNAANKKSGNRAPIISYELGSSAHIHNLKNGKGAPTDGDSKKETLKIKNKVKKL